MSTPTPEVGAGLVDLFVKHHYAGMLGGCLRPCGWRAAPGQPEEQIAEHAEHLARVVQAHVDAAVAAALEGAAARIASERDGHLDSPGLSRSWVAGWGSATDHHAARIAREQIAAEGER